MRRIMDFHVVGAIQVFDHVALAVGSKGLNCVELAFLHDGGFLILRDRYGLTTVDLVWANRVSIEVTHRLHWESLAVELNLIRLDGLLYGSTDVGKSRINPSFLDASVRSFLRCLNDRIILLVESDGKCTVNDAATHLHSKVQLADIVVLEDCIVAVIWGVMCCNPVQGATCGEAPATLQSIGRHELVCLFFQALTHVCHGHTGLDVGLYILPDLPVAFCRSANLLIVVVGESLKLALLCRRCSEGVCTNILYTLSERVVELRILFADWDAEFWILTALLYSQPVLHLSKVAVVLLWSVEDLSSSTTTTTLLLFLLLFRSSSGSFLFTLLAVIITLVPSSLPFSLLSFGCLRALLLRACCGLCLDLFILLAFRLAFFSSLLCFVLLFLFFLLLVSTSLLGSLWNFGLFFVVLGHRV
mmetsp:Transcript_105343/g.187274  ORF Transcript_105343/g.187274 Transcript_105343/m.187274 type:complete len:416 (-) Transcript_105343:51-1298(-)